MSGARKRAKVRVPATAANMGPGFDCLAIALDIWNTVEVEEADEVQVHVEGEGAGELPRGEGNLVYRSCAHLFRKLGGEVPKLHIACENAIPLRRGLGSSASAISGGLTAANMLLGEPLSQEELLNLALELEEHPDNLAASIVGGCVIVLRDGSRWFARPVSVPPGLRAVLFIPEVEVATDHARDILPRQVSRGDAVHNLGRVALMVNALMAGRLEDLRIATQDRLHQPARAQLFPPMAAIMGAALEAGALGAFLAGAGSTILALASGKEAAIGEAMARAGQKAGSPGEVKIVKPSSLGAHGVK